MYGLSPFGKNRYDLFNIFNDFDKDFFSDSMPVNACRTDIKDAGDKYIMESELPGFEKEDIKLDINGSYLVPPNGRPPVATEELFEVNKQNNKQYQLRNNHRQA